MKQNSIRALLCLVSHGTFVSFKIMYLYLPRVSLAECLDKPPSLSWTEELIVSFPIERKETCRNLYEVSE